MTRPACLECPRSSYGLRLSLAQLLHPILGKRPTASNWQHAALMHPGKVQHLHRFTTPVHAQMCAHSPAPLLYYRLCQRLRLTVTVC